MHVATIARTLIDAIDRPEWCGGISDVREILNRARSKASVDKIIEYLPSYRSKSLIQRVGYLLDTFSVGLKPSGKQRLLKICEGSKVYLFSRKTRASSDAQYYLREWQLVVNASGFWRESAQEESR